MGLETFTFKLLAREVVEVLKDKPRVKLLSLGYPDLLVHEDELKGAVDLEGVPKLGDEVGQWHGWRGPVYDTKAVFNKMGIDATFIDIKQIRADERVVDLNLPLPDDLKNQFDVVLDAGTLEHCFNIGQGFQNVIAACNPTALIIHVNPISQVNHGFYNLSPTAYHDLYAANGFGLVSPMILFGPLDKRQALGTHFTNRFSVPSEATNVVLAKRAKVVDFKFPVQWKYQPKQ